VACFRLIAAIDVRAYSVEPARPKTFEGIEDRRYKQLEVYYTL
jgi:hypothetical protein